MDDNYFDDKLKNILESAPEFQPDQSALDDMQRKLRGAQKNKKRFGGLLLLLPLLLLPLIWGAGVLYKKYDALHQQTLEFKQQINVLNQQVSQLNQREGQIEKQIIHHYDTIYNVIYRETYIKENKSNSINYQYNYLNAFPQQKPKLYSSYLNPLRVHRSNVYDWNPDSYNNSLLTKPGSSTLDNRTIGKFNESSSPDIPEGLLNAFNLAVLRIPPFKNIDSTIPSSQTMKDKFPEYNNGKIPSSYYFTPTGISFAANYSPQVFPSHKFGGSAKSYGISTSIEFPEGREMQIGADFLNMKFEEKDPAQYAVFPFISPNDPTDILAEVKGDFTYLQIPVTLRQTFLRKNRLMPTLSAGFVAYKPIRTNIKYEYFNNMGEYKVGETYRNGVFSFDNLRLGLGAKYEIGNYMTAFSEVQYQHGFSLNTNEYFKLRYWALNFGLNYKL